MKKVFLGFLSASIVFLSACGGEENKTDNNTKEQTKTQSNTCLDFAIAEKYSSLDPINVTDVASFHISSQIFESLLRLDEKDLSIQPMLAESWVVADDNLTHTFSLKKGVFFQDNECFNGSKGRELKASDVIYSFKRILSEENSYAYDILKNKIAGSSDFNGEGDINGIKMIDDYTVEFTLTEPSSNFVSLLATISTAIVAKEAIEKNAIVGTGPFIYNSEMDNDKGVTLSRNNNYHIKDDKGTQLPYLECVAFNYVKSGQEQMDLFMEEKLDVITGLPSKSITEIVEKQIADFQEQPVKYVLGRSPQAATTYLTLNNAIAPFNNSEVRKAIGMAIDKNRIVDKILNGEAAGPGEHGIVTSAINNYDYTSVVGLDYNVSKAKELLKKAGYPDGKDFPVLILSSGKGNTGLRVAFEIQKQLVTNLNINVEISSMTLAERRKAKASSEVHMSIDGWLAEFPDPVSFLSLFYGKNVPVSPQEESFPNDSRFKNDSYDKLYEEALVTLDDNKRFELCLKADQIIASEVPGIPLWYHEDYHLIQSSVKNYYPNAMNIQYLTYVKLEGNTAKK